MVCTVHYTSLCGGQEGNSSKIHFLISDQFRKVPVPEAIAYISYAAR